jgi:heterotetrameric sarcosine oxidase alpha subunit
MTLELRDYPPALGRVADGERTKAVGIQPFRLSSGGALDRSRTLRFSFDGRDYTGHPGDTLASALLANGLRLVGRSFKYHRPRGIFASGPEEPNALVTLKRGEYAEPNTRATVTELFAGLVAESQNRWPSLSFDVMSVNGLLARPFPAGFYYKTFMWPGSFWMLYERVIRRAAGMGRASRNPDPGRYEKSHIFCDVLIVGGGPAGISASLAAGRSGARVVLVEADPLFGGGLLRDEEVIERVPASEWIAASLKELASLPNVSLMRRTTAFGYYDHNVVGAVERVTDHLSSPDPYLPRQRFHIIRARRVVLATGSIERPLVFANNDRPGVMLASAVRTYLRRFGVRPGERAVVFANNDDAYRTALDLHTAGVGVEAIVDPRNASDGVLPKQAKRSGIECLFDHSVVNVTGKQLVRSVEITGATNGTTRHINCDIVAVSGGWDPTVHLQSHSGSKPVYNPALGAFVPGPARQAERTIGAANGTFALEGCLAEGSTAGRDSAADAGFHAPKMIAPQCASPLAAPVAPPFWPMSAPNRRSGKAFVDIQDDVTADDIALAHREGYVSVEHLKRYTTLGMGTDQGKTSNVNGLAIMASLRGKPINEVGTTTFRPPYTPVAVGAFAGRETRQHYEPIRRSAMHDWHVANGAAMVEAGLWMRPRAYPRAGESQRAAYIREATHVRNAVGLIDVSTLGKIDIQGPDALELLERVYCNGWQTLGIGRLRYGLMLREDGIVFDDGTTARLGKHHYFMTTTTANAGKVMAHLEFLIQAVWPDLRVHVTSVTEQWAAMAIAGPFARNVLARVIDGGATTVDDGHLPHLGLAEVRIAGVRSRLFRMSFSGERAYEVVAPADRALHVWEALMEAGKPDEIAPYGTEAMGALRIEKGHVSGPELDGRTTADDLGLGKLMSRKKDYVGRRLSERPGLQDPARPKLVGLVPVDRSERLRAGSQLVETANPKGVTPMLGHTTSMTYSPVLGHDVTLALLSGGRSRTNETLWAAYPLHNEVVKVRVVDPVFYDKEGVRLRG